MRMIQLTHNSIDTSLSVKIWIGTELNFRSGLHSLECDAIMWKKCFSKEKKNQIDTNAINLWNEFLLKSNWFFALLQFIFYVIWSIYWEPQSVSCSCVVRRSYCVLHLFLCSSHTTDNSELEHSFRLNSYSAFTHSVSAACNQCDGFVVTFLKSSLTYNVVQTKCHLIANQLIGKTHLCVV